MTLLLPSETLVVLENTLDPKGLSYVYERPERIVTAAGLMLTLLVSIARNTRTLFDAEPLP